MNKDFFNKLKNSNYSNYSSFAIWNENNIRDLNVIYNNLDNLRTDVVIIGLNASGKVNKFQNFHSIHRGGRDSWLCQVFNKSIIRGAYMTDIIKNDISSKQNEVDLNKENIKKI